MRLHAVGSRTFLVLLVLGVVLGLRLQAHAQDSGSSDSGGDSGSSPAVAGVIVDANGVLQKKIFTDTAGQLTRERIAAARASLGPQVTVYSKLRKISLNRLEQAILDRQGVLTDEMRNLAGLLRLRYVFYYPDSKDIVIAGPAEGWVTDPSGRVVGLTSGRPTILLEDLVVALRAFPPGSQDRPMIGCSIDPTQEGLAAQQEFLRNVRPATPGQVESFVQRLRETMGEQDVSISGIPPKTHFAQVMVEADYRMKLIGIGLEKPPVRLASFVDRASASQIARNALLRWFFVPEYQCVRVSEDGLSMELVGDGVKLVGEMEAVKADGARGQAARSNRASQAFVNNFTKKYPELADRSPVYAQLRNLIDLVVAAAFIQEHDYCGQAEWDMPFFGDETQYSVETLSAPKKVDTVVTAVWKGNTVMTPTAGGVLIEASVALEEENLLPDEKDKVAELRKETKPNLAKGQWWWD